MSKFRWSETKTHTTLEMLVVAIAAFVIGYFA